ncbi:MAG: Gfo/Idh/MocA family oxidoreductase, partial [Acidimicrobiales bacterium]
MSNKGLLRWGVISTARIATNKVIPAIQRSEFGRVVAIASRSQEAASAAGAELGIDDCYGSYEALLGDPNIDAIYNPLPNHLHVPWTLKALEAGKHVLCEKPLALSAGQARSFVKAAADYPDLLVSEAFMYRFHPQWLRAKELVDGAELGQLRSIQTWFSYYTDDPDNIRHVAEWGGGGLMDIGCYPVSQARWLFACEPVRVTAVAEIDDRFGVDRLTSALLAFPGGQVTFTCSTQLQPHQWTQLVCEKGRYE